MTLLLHVFLIIRISKRGEEAYAKLSSLNELDIKFYHSAKIVAEAMLEKYSVNVSDRKCLKSTSFLPKNVEHLRAKLNAKNIFLNNQNVLYYGNDTAATELLCVSRKKK